MTPPSLIHGGLPIALVLLAWALPPQVAQGQHRAVEDSLAAVKSIGLPRPFRLYAGLGTGLEMAGSNTVALSRAMIGGSRDITNPVPGLIGLASEAWIGTRSHGMDGGARLMFASNAAGIQVGGDYSLRLGRADLAVAVLQPLRRGGILLPGAGLRFDWIPARSAFTASLSVPLFQRRPGKTRPRAVGVVPVEAARPPPPQSLGGDAPLRGALGDLREAAMSTSRLVTPFLPPGEPAGTAAEARRIRGLLDGVSQPDRGHTDAMAAIRRYHELLGDAFELALDSALEPGSRPEIAAAVTDTARRMLLDDVLVPFDRDLGRIRRPAVLRALRDRAGAAFAEWLAMTPLVPEERRHRVLAVHRHLLAIVQESADSAQARWGDSRYVWLPLQYALRPEEHDTQTEIDGFVERITGVPFERGHDLVYATDERFEPALQRSIRETRDYHVLWIHDFAGRNPDGGPDLVAQQVVGAYLESLTAAAESFDRTRKVPTFLIFLDQYYYRRSRSAWWLRLLDDPLGHEFELPSRYRHVERVVHEAQQRLRRAVAESPAIQDEARRRGSRWLRRLFAVQVNVTFPPDPSFRGPRGTGTLVSGMTDDLMRDHRKVAFSDITERDPSRGIAILTGLGVGEHYARYQWLDRTLVVRGPAAVTLKTEARALLRSQGFRESEIPPVLRADPIPADMASQVAELESRGWEARVAIAINTPGYGPKRATAAKAALYTLLPPGCTIIAADPQWLSRFWGGMLLGSALRGCRVLLIGPGPANAPFSTSYAQSTLQRDLFLRIMTARDTLRRALDRSGGMLAIGLFRVGYGTYNVPAGVREVRDGLRRHPFLREVLPFHQGVWDLFEQTDSLLLALGNAAPPDTAVWYHPRFHLKTQFFGSAEGMREALGRPEWRRFFERRIGERLHESPAGTDITLDHLSVLRDHLAGRTSEVRDRQVLYLEVGSHNQDPRSFMLDGEALCLVAGESALLAAGDMLLLSTAGVEWLDGAAELDRYFPLRSGPLTEAVRAAEPIF
jgi:hypothetical protein